MRSGALPPTPLTGAAELALYHLSAKAISRNAGRSATGAAAYRAGEYIYDERTGMVHDYTHKAGVLYTELILPDGGHADRAAFWNALEHHHQRRDAILAREIEIALPAELTPEARQELAIGFAHELADRYRVAADLALHAPRPISDAELARNPEQHHEFDQELGRHNGNWHAHILLSACTVSPHGDLGKKAVELDPIHCQRHHLENIVERERAHWAESANHALEQAGYAAQLDHRSHAARGIEAEPSQHLGPAAAGFERHTGEPSRKRLDFAQAAHERQALNEALSALEQEWQPIDRALRYVAGEALDGPILAMDRREIEQGLATAAARYDDWQHMQTLKAQAQEQYQTWKVEQDRQQRDQERQRQQEQQREREQEQQRQREQHAEQQRQQAEVERAWQQLAQELRDQAERQREQQQQQRSYQHDGPSL